MRAKHVFILVMVLLFLLAPTLVNNLLSAGVAAGKQTICNPTPRR